MADDGKHILISSSLSESHRNHFLFIYNHKRWKMQRAQKFTIYGNRKQIISPHYMYVCSAKSLYESVYGGHLVFKEMNSSVIKASEINIVFQLEYLILHTWPLDSKTMTVVFELFNNTKMFCVGHLGYICKLGVLNPNCLNSNETFHKLQK